MPLPPILVRLTKPVLAVNNRPNIFANKPAIHRQHYTPIKEPRVGTTHSPIRIPQLVWILIIHIRPLPNRPGLVHVPTQRARALETPLHLVPFVEEHGGS